LTAFAVPGAALAAAAAIQHRLASQAWQPLPAHWLKLTLHRGPAELRNDSDYLPNETLMQLVRMSRLTQGGQILLSGEMAAAVQGNLSEDMRLHDLGELSLPGRQQTVRVFQVVLPLLVPMSGT
jgi:class 3 adenylate cyclase